MYCSILLMADQGLLAVWKKRYWPNQDNCLPPDQAQPMKLSDIQGPLYMTFGLIGAAVTVLCLENVWCILWEGNRKLVIEAVQHFKQKFDGSKRKYKALHFENDFESEVEKHTKSMKSYSLPYPPESVFHLMSPSDKAL